MWERSTGLCREAATDRCLCLSTAALQRERRVLGGGSTFVPQYNLVGMLGLYFIRLL